MLLVFRLAPQESGDITRQLLLKYASFLFKTRRCVWFVKSFSPVDFFKSSTETLCMFKTELWFIRKTPTFLHYVLCELYSVYRYSTV